MNSFGSTESARQERISRADRPTPDEFAAMARTDFWCFVELAFGVLHPGQPLVYAPYLELLSCYLMRVAEGKYRRLVFNLPPRHMKSMLVSVLYPAWQLGRNPATKFICISYGDDLAHHLSAETRKLMLSDVYRWIFPGTRLDKKAVDYIRTSAGGYRYATSVGSDITGFGANEIIIDDPMQPDDAGSEIAKERVRTWTETSVMTRFNDPSQGVLILVMQRLAPDDLSATFENSGAFKPIKLPLIAERQEHFTFDDRTIMRRQTGDCLNPRRMDSDEVERLKASLSPHVFSSQYQQRPTAGGSGMLSIERFRRYDLREPPAFELMIHSWDIGATVGGNASVCTKWGLVREASGTDVLYLTGIVRLQVELPAVLAAIKAEDLKEKPELIVLDERGVGLGVFQFLWQEGYRHVQKSTQTHEPLQTEGSAPMRPSASKIERFGRAVLAIDAGRVIIPQEGNGIESFLYEVASFPNIPDKDQVDSMSQLIGNIDQGIRFARQRKRSNSFRGVTARAP